MNSVVILSGAKDLRLLFTADAVNIRGART